MMNERIKDRIQSFRKEELWRERDVEREGKGQKIVTARTGKEGNNNSQ